jgi:hypothetical protein
MKLPWLKVRSEQEIHAIHGTSLGILQKCGVRILNDRMLAFLKGQGLDVDEEARGLPPAGLQPCRLLTRRLSIHRLAVPLYFCPLPHPRSR